jgi:hypothetical protein
MKKIYLSVLLTLLLLGTARPASAEWMRCARDYITGLLTEHYKGLSILGNETTPVLETMSVYITIGNYHGKRALYVQSNFQPPQYDRPIKIAVNDAVDLKTALYWIPYAGRSTPFDTRQVTFYVEPSFFKDPVFGKYKNQIDGKLIVLDERLTASLGIIKPSVPEGWIVIENGVIQNAQTKLPAFYIKLSKKADTKLVAVDPKISRDGHAFMIFQESQGFVRGEPLGEETLKKLIEVRQLQTSSKFVEAKIFEVVGKTVLRAVEDTGGSNKTPLMRCVTYLYQNGQNLDIVQGDARKDIFDQFGQTFQNAFLKTIFASSYKSLNAN